ncbi:winged helix-turn-helix domain-containing protein [Streptomyces sp. NBC_01187]|uniref:winged helix-turn-helix domain-containing protein n=1 Tax=Streptomyces sp. NBC_01187 TaxID=2903766 RepID=UPI0038707215|nr:winged helix-turn-helix domain-containing protein [Streptomyces sp. NBC_01187]
MTSALTSTTAHGTRQHLTTITVRRDGHSPHHGPVRTGRSPGSLRAPVRHTQEPDPGAGTPRVRRASDHPPGEAAIGPTRRALPADLDVPRTTTQLAALHQLSPSTISYHLTQLHRAGLLTRARTRNSVYYQRGGTP